LSRHFAGFSACLAVYSGCLRDLSGFPLFAGAGRAHLLANPSPFTHSSRDQESGDFMFSIAVRSGGPHFSLLLAMVFLIWLPPAAGWAYSAEEQAACTDDAFRLCGAEIPDVDRVTACMVRQQSRLSAGCRVYFRSDPPEPAAASGKPLSIKPAHRHKPHKPRKHASRKPA
jgi:hypothetical protein